MRPGEVRKGTQCVTGADDIVVVLGTRPEAIKLAGLCRAAGSRARVVHTGQHYDAQLWHDVVDDLAGVSIATSVEIGGRSRGEQIGSGVEQLTRYLHAHPARCVVVQGDTNSTLAGALAASSLQIPVVHVEAGLRSHDRSMPEEMNRILVDAIADLCCAPTPANAQQLQLEGVNGERVVVTGNTLAGALSHLLPAPDVREDIVERAGLPIDGYILCTIHRAGTVDDRRRLSTALSAVHAMSHRAPVLMPMHPHTAHNVRRWGLEPLLKGLRVVPPMAPREFLAFEAGAAMIVSDSGGVQEEACFLRRPLVVLRDSTERPELLDGWCRLVGTADPGEVLAQAWTDLPDWRKALQARPFPYGTQDTSACILTEIGRRWPAS
jgi:UDP-N-acetylglucosamine 2-epimerase (non-hydrolysing)